MPKAESFLCIVLLNMAETILWRGAKVGLGSLSPAWLRVGDVVACYTGIKPGPYGIVMLPAYMSM